MYSVVIIANYTVLLTGQGRTYSLFSKHPFFLPDLRAQAWPSGFAEVPHMSPSTLWPGIGGGEQSRPCVTWFLSQCWGRSWVGAFPWLLQSSWVSRMTGLRGLAGGDFWRAAGPLYSSLSLLPQPRACTELVLKRWVLSKWVEGKTRSQQEGELGRKNRASRWGCLERCRSGNTNEH